MRKVIALVAAWLPFLGLWMMFALQMGPLTLGQVFLRSVIAVAGAALLGLLVSRFCRGMPLPSELQVRFYAVHLLGAVTYAAAWTGVMLASGWILEGRPAPRAMLVEWLLEGVWLYALVAGVSYAIQTQRRSLEIERSLAVARLDALRSRLHPHFLFNALHTVGALVRHDPAEAESAVEKLGDMLRYTLHDREGDTVPFAEEWEFTRRYLDFEQLRYGSRLQVVTEIDPQSLVCSSPSFALQTLVENSVRHSISRRPEGGRVEISARTGNDRLHVRVRDDGGNALPPLESGARYGLSALRQRLEAIYGPAAQLAIERDGGGFEVSFTIPCVRPQVGDDE